MAELLITHPTLFRDVQELDFTFTSGMTLPLVLDVAMGDQFHETDAKIIVTLTAKPSMNLPDETIPAETVTIYKAGLATMQQRFRKIRVPSPEEQFALQETMLKLSGTVQ